MITDGLGELEAGLADEFQASGASLYLLVDAEIEMARESWVLG